MFFTLNSNRTRMTRIARIFTDTVASSKYKFYQSISILMFKNLIGVVNKYIDFNSSQKTQSSQRLKQLCFANFAVRILRYPNRSLKTNLINNT